MPVSPAKNYLAAEASPDAIALASFLAAFLCFFFAGLADASPEAIAEAGAAAEAIADAGAAAEAIAEAANAEVANIEAIMTAINFFILGPKGLRRR
jgi:hypothetical protein